MERIVNRKPVGGLICPKCGQTSIVNGDRIKCITVANGIHWKDRYYCTNQDCGYKTIHPYIKLEGEVYGSETENVR